MGLDGLNGKKTYIAAGALALLGLSKLLDGLANNIAGDWSSLISNMLQNDGWTLLAQALAALGIRHAVSKTENSITNRW